MFLNRFQPCCKAYISNSKLSNKIRFFSLSRDLLFNKCSFICALQVGKIGLISLWRKHVSQWWIQTMSLASKLIQSFVTWTVFSLKNRSVSVTARHQSPNTACMEAKARVLSHPLGLKIAEVFWLLSNFKYSPILQVLVYFIYTKSLNTLLNALLSKWNNLQVSLMYF